MAEVALLLVEQARSMSLVASFGVKRGSSS
jgi:hypothetical protein